MRLSNFERDAISCLLKKRIDCATIDTVLSACTISGYEFTKAGYYIQIFCKGWNLEKETIHKPLLIGKGQEIEVGFLLFTDGETLTLECHSWGEDDLLENIRHLELIIEEP